MGAQGDRCPKGAPTVGSRPMTRPARWWSAGGRSLVGLLDRLARWARMPPPPVASARRFRWSRSADALTRSFGRRPLAGAGPALGRLIRRGAVELHPIPSGLPTSTPAFQAGPDVRRPRRRPGLPVPRQADGVSVVPAAMGCWRPWKPPTLGRARHRPRRSHLRVRVRGWGRRHGSHLRPRPSAQFVVGAGQSSDWIVPYLILAWLVAKMSVVSLWEIFGWLWASGTSAWAVV